MFFKNLSTEFINIKKYMNINYVCLKYKEQKYIFHKLFHNNIDDILILEKLNNNNMRKYNLHTHNIIHHWYMISSLTLKKCFKFIFIMISY